jgi:LysM domain
MARAPKEDTFMARDVEQTTVDEAAAVPCGKRRPKNQYPAQCNWNSPGNPRPCHHVVTKGQTMSTIAAHYKVDLKNFERDNPQITNPNLICPGDVLNVRK